MFTDFTMLGRPGDPVLLSYTFPGGHVFHAFLEGITRVQRRGPLMLPNYSRVDKAL